MPSRPKSTSRRPPHAHNNNNPMDPFDFPIPPPPPLPRQAKLNPKISLLALLFGMGSWIAITGLWLEMPLLIQRLPEGWRLASHINIMIQFANIGPLLYWAAHRRRLLNEITATHLQMLIGMSSIFGLILAWNWTSVVGGAEHSVVLFVATFGLALVDCTSSVTFLPFMARFDSGYMTPYLVGEGLSGFIPSMVALLQGVGENRKECGLFEAGSLADVEVNETATSGKNITKSVVLDLERTSSPTSLTGSLIEPRFSVEIFFFSLFFTIFISYTAFVALQVLPDCREEMESVRKRVRQKASTKKMKVYQRVLEIGEDGVGVEPIETEFEEVGPVSGDGYEDDRPGELIVAPEVMVVTEQMTKQKRIYYYLLLLMCCNCFTTFGFFPSVQPYSALPYGVEILHYVVILSGLAYPAGCFLGMLVENKSVKIVNLLTAIGTLAGLYILTCALLSPTPPFVETNFGGVLMICAWILFVGILSYAKTMITLWICDYNSRKGMFWVGMNQQFGAAFGAALNFILINYSKLFNEC